MTREIPLWRPQAEPGTYYIALVDDDDYIKVLEAGPWHVQRGAQTNYVHRSIIDGGKRRGELLHRFLLAEHLSKESEVDHVSGNGLDCRRGNLRIVARGENAQNIRRETGNRKRPKSSRYRGVCLDKSRGEWLAYVSPAGKRVWLGRFDDESEAARVAAAARTRYFPFVNEARHPVTPMSEVR